MNNTEGDAALLQFPREFQKENGAEILMNGEVLMLLDHRRQQMELKEEIQEFTEMQQKSLDYVSRVSKFKSIESIRAARAVFGEYPFHQFEAAQLINLSPETVDEAKSLIPSLADRISDEELTPMLQEIQGKKSFQ